MFSGRPVHFFRLEDDACPNSKDQPLATRSAYSLDTRLGEGSVGVVFSATIKSTGKRVAIKKIDVEDSNSEAKYYAENNFVDEVLVVKQLNHPHIVQTFECFGEKKTFYFVMELCVCDLWDYIEKKENGGQREGLPEKEAVEKIRDLGEAVKYCHSLNFVHCDIKCENVLVDAKGEGKAERLQRFNSLA